MTDNKSSILQKLKEQKAKLEERIQAAEAREKAKVRKQEMRRQQLVGAYYLELAHKDNTYQDLVNRLSSYLTRNSDRALFDLPPLKKGD